jgi:tripartite motif-containing protein 71
MKIKTKGEIILKKSFFVWMFLLVFSLVLAGCGGSDNGTTSPTPTPTPNPSNPEYVWGYDWGGSGSTDGKFAGPYGIAIDANGYIYVADQGNNRIQVFGVGGGSMKLKWGSFGLGYFLLNHPYGIALDSSDSWNIKVYVVDSRNHRIVKYNVFATYTDSDVTYLTSWGSSGTGNGQFNNPRDIAIDAAGNVYITDYDNYRIQKFDSNGNFIAKWGSQGSGDGQFDKPNWIAVDSAGNVYVTEGTPNNRVQKFSSTGSFIKKWGGSGSSNGQFSQPEDITVDSSNNIYVVDTGNYRVQKFDSSGNFITQWTTCNPAKTKFYGEGIVVKNSVVYVTDFTNDKVVRFDPVL